MEGEKDDSFVSISLDGSECEICLQDTGEALTTCDICARPLTRGPVQEGFNQIPVMVHIETRAHGSCFRKFHKLARRLGRGSPKRGDSVAGPPHGIDAHATREQWLNFNSNNLGSELLLENIRNRVSKSNPGSRRGSPVLFGRRLVDHERCRSEPKLDLSAQELRRSYTKYLFGKQDEETRHNSESQGNPSLKVTSSSEIEQVPVDEDYNKENVEHRECKAESGEPSCHSNMQYLEPKHTLTLNQCRELVQDNAKAEGQGEERADDSGPRKSEGGRDITGRDRSALEITDGGGWESSFRAKETQRMTDDEWWRDINHLTKECLHHLTLPQLMTRVQRLKSAVNDAGSQLVRYLQEKDVISSEVSSRHVTIQKLVQRQTTLHH